MRAWASAVWASASATPAKTVGWGNGNGEFDGAAFDGQGFSIYQGVGNLLVSGFKDSAERLSRDFHLLGGLLLVEALKVCQADRLKLIHREVDVLEDGKGDSPGLIEGHWWQVCHAPALPWSGHNANLYTGSCDPNGRRCFVHTVVGRSDIE